MATPTVPQRLFKYQAASIEAITNLSNAKLWFSHPHDFNDPFDCAFDVEVRSPQADEHLAVLKPLLDPRDFAKIEQMNPGEMVETVRKQLEALINRSATYARGICCFSEKGDDLLMWGHYASGHRGFCLEFDTHDQLFSVALPVQYSDEFPKITLKQFLNENPHGALALLLTKARNWEYEQEWRALHKNARLLYGYDRKHLVSVYFGAKMSEPQQLMIAKVLNGLPTRLFRMRLSKESFKLHPEPVEFQGIDYSSATPGSL